MNPKAVSEQDESRSKRARPLHRGFPPVISADSRLLILGSFPSEASLTAGHYYAHPRNQFWPILGDALGEPLTELPFDERYRRVLAHGLAIWDVISACSREGSLDSAIREAQANDFSILRARGSAIERVLFNGRLAGRHAPTFAAQGYDVAVLPSTSPAFAGMRFEDKRTAWRQALQGFGVAW